MKKMLQKMKNKKGFTLMEMLIVVAIIVILVAVSVPTFTTQLESARKAADDANIRSAQGLFISQYFTGEWPAATATEKKYYYDAKKGEIKDAKTGIEAYGQSRSYKDQIIEITVKLDAGKDKIEYGWVNKG